MWPTAYAIASTMIPIASATTMSPDDGAENNPAPQIALTSPKVPTNSARYFLVSMVPIDALQPCPIHAVQIEAVDHTTATPWLTQDLQQCQQSCGSTGRVFD